MQMLASAMACLPCRRAALLLAALSLLIALAPVPTRAQSPNPLPPFAYAITLGTSQAQVLAANPARKRLIFLNPSTTATVAVCPPISRGSGNPSIACAVNGAGSITLPPYGTFAIDAGAPGNQGFSMGTSWNAIASAPSSPLTILESE